MTDLDRFAALQKKASTLHSSLADAIGDPSHVYCRTCGSIQPVNASHCLRNGWPKCCGYTMTVDKPGKDTP